MMKVNFTRIWWVEVLRGVVVELNGEFRTIRTSSRELKLQCTANAVLQPRAKQQFQPHF
jgi:hypothetical protein